MRIRIIVNYVARYRRGHASHFVPPVTCMHLAALTPPDHEVELVHEQVSEIPFDWQDKFAWFWDDNLLVQRRWAKDLLREMVGLRRYWLTQASIDIVKDRELLSLMEKSGCAGIFLGIESLDAASIAEVDKKQNRVAEYRSAIDSLHDHGICVMAGFISGFDEQTEESIVRTAEGLNEIGVDVPFLSILTPFRGTPLYDQLLAEGRILGDRGWDHYNGYNVTFRPRRMSPEGLLRAHRELWNQAFGYTLVAERLARGVRTLSRGGMMLSAAMNGFYGLKRATGNVPAVAREYPTVPIAHPDPTAPGLPRHLRNRGQPR